MPERRDDELDGVMADLELVSLVDTDDVCVWDEVGVVGANVDVL